MSAFPGLSAVQQANQAHALQLQAQLQSVSNRTSERTSGNSLTVDTQQVSAAHANTRCTNPHP